MPEEYYVIGTLFMKALYFLGAAIMKGLYYAASACETLLTDMIKFLDLSNYPAAQEYIEYLVPLGVVLGGIVIVGIGFLITVGNEKIRLSIVTKNVLIAVAIVFLLPTMITLLGQLTKSGAEYIRGAAQESLSFQVIKENTVDLLSIDAGLGNNILTKESFERIPFYKFSTIVDPEEEQLNNPDNFKYTYVLSVNGTFERKELNQKLLTIDKEYYLRWHFNFGTIFATLFTTILVYGLTALKMARIIYEILVNQIILTLTSFIDLATGERVKKIIPDIVSGFLAIAIFFLLIRLYIIAMSFIPTLDISKFAQLVIMIAISFAVIDGPNMIEKLIGIDAGLKDAWRTAAGAYTASKAIASAPGKVKQGLKAVKQGINYGKGKVESLSEQVGKARDRVAQNRQNKIPTLASQVAAAKNGQSVAFNSEIADTQKFGINTTMSTSSTNNQHESTKVRHSEIGNAAAGSDQTASPNPNSLENQSPASGSMAAEAESTVSKATAPAQATSQQAQDAAEAVTAREQASAQVESLNDLQAAKGSEQTARTHEEVREQVASRVETLEEQAKRAEAAQGTSGSTDSQTAADGKYGGNQATLEATAAKAQVGGGQADTIHSGVQGVKVGKEASNGTSNTSSRSAATHATASESNTGGKPQTLQSQASVTKNDNVTVGGHVSGSSTNSMNVNSNVSGNVTSTATANQTATKSVESAFAEQPLSKPNYGGGGSGAAAGTASTTTTTEQQNVEFKSHIVNSTPSNLQKEVQESSREIISKTTTADPQVETLDMQHAKHGHVTQETINDTVNKVKNEQSSEVREKINREIISSRKKIHQEIEQSRNTSMNKINSSIMRDMATKNMDDSTKK